MIAKHVSMRSLGKSDYGSLVNYITDAQSKDHRLGAVTVTNCETTLVPDAISEVLATQFSNKRARGDKTFHLVVSFRAGEQPGDSTLRAIEARICAGLGYGEHQRVSAVHNDTDNLHLHIAINKIHPVRHTMHEPYYSHQTLAELCATLERDYGLESDNHTPHRRSAESRAFDMEQHAGVDSLVGWIRRECLQEIKQAPSWSELHHVLLDNGLELSERANGLVFKAADGTTVKASTVDRDLSKPSLVARLGFFEASEQQVSTAPTRQYRKDPIRLRVNTVELYARYKAEQQGLSAARGDALQHARERRDRLIDAAKRSGRLRRATIKVVGDSRANKKLLYALASKALRDEIQAVHRHHQQERTALIAEHARRTWADWLKLEAQRGNGEALMALRARQRAGSKGNTLQGEGQVSSGHAPVVDGITKKGTIIYRAGLTAVRDDGDRLQVSREATREGLQEALRLALQRYGNHITVNGSLEFKAQIIRAAVESRLPITFVDPALESRRHALSNLESSHERAERPEHRGRTGLSPGRTGQQPAVHQHLGAIASLGRTEQGRSGSARADDVAARSTRRKPDLGRIGRVPPPQGQHRLRTLSELGVVRFAEGAEVLLPRDVPGHLEQPGAQSDHALRRGVSSPGTGLGKNPAGLEAADRYIAEREAKRKKGFDIPKHCRYTGFPGAVTFQGSRNVDGQALALLKRGDEVMVMPVDTVTTRHLRRIAVGDVVSITPQGFIKAAKGRGR
jgi:hypothetical protein